MRMGMRSENSQLRANATTYLLNENFDELSLVSGLDSGEYLTGGSREDIALLLGGQFLELGTREAALISVGILREDGELLSDSDSGFLLISCDHDDVDTSSLALLDSLLDLGANGVLNANVAYKRAVTLSLFVLVRIGQQIRSVLSSDVLHVATVKSDSDSKDAKSLAGNLLHLGHELLAGVLIKVRNVTIASHDLRALLENALGGTL